MNSVVTLENAFQFLNVVMEFKIANISLMSPTVQML